MSLQNNIQLAFSDINSQLRVTSGNVGIGTTAPAYHLDVTGDINFTGSLFQNDTPFSGGGGGGGGGDWTTTGSTNVVYQSGNVGIGTTSPQARLHVSGGALIGTNITRTSYTRLNTAANYAIPPAASGTVNGVNITALNRRTRASNGTQNLSVQTWASRTLPSSSIWLSVVWAAEIGTFCAIASGSNVAATSNDGITWTTQTLPASQNWDSVVWAPELGTFCAVASGSASAATSPDGVTWTAQTLPSSQSWSSVIWSAELGLFCTVATGATNVAATSPDVITWTSRTLPASDNWSSVTWSPELGAFCAVSSGTSTAVSSDGTTWTSGTMVNSRSWSSVAWSPELGTFCAVALNSNVCAISSNGISWTEQSMPSLSDWSSVVWAPELGVFCAVSSTVGTLAATSPTGTTWTSRTLPSSQTWQSITWSPELSVFCVVAISSNIAAISTPAIPASMNTVEAPVSQFSINTAGNIAIGTTSLSANRSLTVSGVGVSFGNAIEMEILNRSFTSANLRLGVTNTVGAIITNSVAGAGVIANDWGHLEFGTGTGGTAQTHLVITTSGSIGVRTTSPSYTFDINNLNSRFPAIRLGHFPFGGGVPPGFRFQNSTLGGLTYNFHNVVLHTGGTGLSLFDITNNVSRMLISSTGNIGFGTTAPSFRIDVVGNFAATSITTSNIGSNSSTVSNISTQNITVGNVITSEISSSNIITTNGPSLNNLLGTNATISNISSWYITSSNIRATTISSGSVLSTTFTGGNMSLSGDYFQLNSNYIESFNTTDRLESDLTINSIVSSAYTGGNVTIDNQVNVANATVSNVVITLGSCGTIVSNTYTGGNALFSNSINGLNASVSNIVSTHISTGTLRLNPNNLIITTSSTLGNIITGTNSTRIGINTSSQNGLHVSGNIVTGSRITKTNYNIVGTTGNVTVFPSSNGLINGVNITAINRMSGNARTLLNPTLTSVTRTTFPSAGNRSRVLLWISELGLFVASGDQIETSPDGITWTTRVAFNNGSFSSGIAWSPQLRRVVVGAGSGSNSIRYSSDCINWTLVSNVAGVSTFNPIGRCIWIPELEIYCAVNSSDVGILFVSSDGISWTSNSLPLSRTWSNIIWAPEIRTLCLTSSSKLVGPGSVANSNDVLVTTDFVNWSWTEAQVPIARASYTGWSPELQLFFATDFSDNRFTTSSNGINWSSPVTLPISTVQNMSWISKLGIFFGVSNSNSTWSYNGVTWYSANLPITSLVVFGWSDDLSILAFVGSGSTQGSIATSILPASMNTVKLPSTQMSTDTAGNLTITTSIRATNNSNTVGNIRTTGGNVGIGVTPSFQLHLNTDSAAKPSTNTWTVSSDSRLKTDITLANLETCYNNVKALPLKRYTWRDDVYTPEQVPDRSKLGWIAQDVETVIPKAVEQHEQHGFPDCRSLNSDQIIASLYGCVQKLTEKVEILETERNFLRKSFIKN